MVAREARGQAGNKWQVVEAPLGSRQHAAHHIALLLRPRQPPQLPQNLPQALLLTKRTVQPSLRYQVSMEQTPCQCWQKEKLTHFRTSYLSERINRWDHSDHHLTEQSCKASATCTMTSGTKATFGNGNGVHDSQGCVH